jgi:CBS-domain-containing membrane protein
MQGSFLAGILTERDVLRAAASGVDLSVSIVSAWMTPDPHAASPETSAEEAAQIMFLNGFRHLPVAEDGRVCGVVSLRDLFAARIRRPSAGEPSARGVKGALLLSSTRIAPDEVAESAKFPTDSDHRSSARPPAPGRGMP